MITFLKGILVDKQPARVVVDVHDVGYELFIPVSSYDRLPRVGETFQILVYEHIREDLHQLFGFMSEGERRMFLLLLAVSGVGPKIAMSALSGLSARELTAAIVRGDVKRLSSVSGIGRKLAERIVLELKDRIGDADGLEAVAGGNTPGPEDLRIRDAVLALVALGYRQDAAKKMVVDVLRGGQGDLSVEALVKAALAGHG